MKANISAQQSYASSLRAGGGSGGGRSGGGRSGSNAEQGTYQNIQSALGHFAGLRSVVGTVGGVFSDILGPAGELEDAIYALGVVSGKGVGQIRQLRGQFIEMSYDSRYSAKELINATESVVRTGRNIEDAMLIMKSANELATASFSSLESATNTVNKAMVAFQMDASDAAKVAEIFHNSVISTPLDLQQLDDSLKQSASAFGAIIQNTGKSGEALQDYKVDVIETMTVLTGLQSMLGRTGSQAGTTLKMNITSCRIVICGQ
ncbi:MAG: phage tail tape measure protein [Mycoplasma sp.]